MGNSPLTTDFLTTSFLSVPNYGTPPMTRLLIIC